MPSRGSTWRVVYYLLREEKRCRCFFCALAIWDTRILGVKTFEETSNRGNFPATPRRGTRGSRALRLPV